MSKIYIVFSMLKAFFKVFILCLKDLYRTDNYYAWTVDFHSFKGVNANKKRELFNTIQKDCFDKVNSSSLWECEQENEISFLTKKYKIQPTKICQKIGK